MDCLRRLQDMMELEVEIIAGKDLAAKDKVLLGKNSSERYVNVTYLRDVVAQTKVVKKSLAPTWNKRFTLRHLPLEKDEPNPQLRFEIFDWDQIGKDDPMGVVVVDLNTLKDGTKHTAWYPVANCQGCDSAKGSLHLTITKRVDHVQAVTTEVLEVRSM